METDPPEQRRKSGDARKNGFLILAIAVVTIIVIIAGVSITAKDDPENPFLTYPLQVELFEVQQYSNNSFMFTAWVENQDYNMPHEGSIHCTIFFNDEEGEVCSSASFSSGMITVGPGERSMFTVWSVEIAESALDQTYRCQIVQ